MLTHPALSRFYFCHVARTYPRIRFINSNKIGRPRCSSSRSKQCCSGSHTKGRIAPRCCSCRQQSPDQAQFAPIYPKIYPGAGCPRSPAAATPQAVRKIGRPRRTSARPKQRCSGTHTKGRSAPRSCSRRQQAHMLWLRC